MSERVKREFRRRIKRLVKLKRDSFRPGDARTIDIDVGDIHIRWVHQYQLSASEIVDGNRMIIFQEIKKPSKHSYYNIDQMREAIPTLQRALILDELANA